MNTPAPSPLLSTAVLATCAAVSGAAHGALWAGHALAGTGETVPGNPAEALARISTGVLSWPPASTLLLVVAPLLMVLGLLAGAHRERRRSPETVLRRSRARRSRQNPGKPGGKYLFLTASPSDSDSDTNKKRTVEAKY